MSPLNRLLPQLAPDGATVDPPPLRKKNPYRTRGPGSATEKENGTGGGRGDAACLHELFEVQARRIPHATALVVGTERLTYRELNLRANRVAHHLRSLGVGRETLVATFLERSADMVVALLGVLKAGGA